VGVRVDRVVRARGATTVAKGGQKRRAAALPWGRWAHYANSAAVSHECALTRDALRLSLRCREDRSNVPVSQGWRNTQGSTALGARDLWPWRERRQRRERLWCDSWRWVQNWTPTSVRIRR